MAKYISAAPDNGFTVEQVTQGQPYPADEVARYLETAPTDTDPGITETEALRQIEQAVDTSDVIRLGDGATIVYAYGYRCAPDRLKVGRTDTGDALQRIAMQINTGTPDKPVLLLEIKTHDCSSLERAIHAILASHPRNIKVPRPEDFGRRAGMVSGDKG
jgi:hypothetical protein